MNKDMEKTIKRLKSKSVISPIVGFFFSVLGSVVVVGIVCMAFLAIILDSKFDSAAYSTNRYKAQIEGQLAKDEDYDSILQAINSEGKRPMAISVCNKDNDVISFYGEKVDHDSDFIVDVNEEDAFEITLSNNAKDSYQDKANELQINIHDLVKEILQYEGDIDTLTEMTPFFERVIFYQDYWIESELSNGNVVYVKYELEIFAKDILELIALAAIMCVLFVISSIGRLISAISNIVSQRYFLSLLLKDPVVGGYNGFAFESYAFKYVTSALNRKSAFAIIDLSLQKYQNYCTLYGVEEGEQILKIMEKVIQRNLGSNEIVSHISSGDFMILLKTEKNQCDEKALAARARTIIDSLPGKLIENYKGSGSIAGISNINIKSGFYYLPEVSDEESKRKRSRNELNIKNLCIMAGIAKSALAEDSGMMVYNHDMWEKEIWERKVEDMMQDALDNEEFSVYIQPKYHPSTEKLCGGEALVRWISPTEGFISPGQFIPIFERTGFVTKLDDYMILHTAKLQSDWLAAGKKIVPISVNVSRAHFAQPDLAEHIKALVDNYPLPHEYIEIELTESAFFDDKNALLSTVNKLQEYGFEVSMDDFGSGYSSLNSLKDLPLNVLKLDAEFFRGEDFDGRGEIVVSEAIALAKQLNMRIVAEGVEKKEQVDFLASHDCDMIQGFYFAKPMPANEYESRME